MGRKTQALGRKTQAYCEMKDPGYFGNCDWDEIYKKLMASGTESLATKEGFATKVRIDGQKYDAVLFYTDD
ncbi:hypothetical protein L2E82_48510 [Cichorium intybus]|uniref:Uncharacterized protein n=1 Tax=Cichorium intybus TaxID=13427 RepID=A0ACB8YZE3_CICIN|nr:hypothetical protein L2E82_48510 [Cichorium intybus]